jgi:hypothetical protein
MKRNREDPVALYKSYISSKYHQKAFSQVLMMEMIKFLTLDFKEDNLLAFIEHPDRQLRIKAG